MKQAQSNLDAFGKEKEISNTNRLGEGKKPFLSHSFSGLFNGALSILTGPQSCVWSCSTASPAPCAPSSCSIHHGRSLAAPVPYCSNNCADMRKGCLGTACLSEQPFPACFPSEGRSPSPLGAAELWFHSVTPAEGQQGWRSALGCAVPVPPARCAHQNMLGKPVKDTAGFIWRNFFLQVEMVSGFNNHQVSSRGL